MKFTITTQKCRLALAALIATTVPAWAANSAHVETHSVYTDLKKDCVTIAAANDQAEIDFSEVVCKSFGGYDLHIAGGDLRYAPTLAFNGQPIALAKPGAFHDTGSDKIEWIYQRAVEADGNGQLVWTGLVYRLSVDDGSGSGKAQSKLFAVRLDGARTCLLGEARDNVTARQMVATSQPDCK